MLTLGFMMLRARVWNIAWRIGRAVDPGIQDSRYLTG
jgi:hypothetical protein